MLDNKVTTDNLFKDMIETYNKIAYCIFDNIDRTEVFCKQFNTLNDGYNCKKCNGFTKSCLNTVCHRLESVIDSLLEKA